MSIETLLTLGVAAAILVVAALLRVVILGVVRIGLRLSGRRIWWLERSRRWDAAEDTDRPKRPERARLWPRIVRGARSAASAVAFLVSGTIEGLGIMVVGLARGADALGVALAPRLRGGFRTSAGSAAAATAWLGPRLREAGRRTASVTGSALARVKPAIVLAIATLQHLVLALAGRTRAWIQQHEVERSARPGEPTSAGDGPRVIDLDHDFDPLTDDFPEDRIGSSV